MPKKILLVDDEPMIVSIMKKRLASHHYEVFTAADGPSCLQIAKEIKPDLILLDLLMPGMDGHETCKQLKAAEETKKIPVLVFSANVKTGIQTKCIEEGAVGVIFKPDLYELYPAIEAVLRGDKIEEGFD